MMHCKKYLTDKELLLNNRHQIHRFSKLALDNRPLFKEITEYLPFIVTEARIGNLDYISYNPYLELLVKDGGEQLQQKGHSYILEIADLKVHREVLRRIQLFKQQDDRDSVLTYLQLLYVGDQKHWLLTNKAFLDDQNFITLGHDLSNFGLIGRTIENILEEPFLKNYEWALFESLTKTERQIIKLLAEGNCNKQVADLINTSFHTVNTHKKNIYKKLQINSISELVKLYMAAQLF